MEGEFRRDNHYVPCLSLRRFAGSDGRLSTYRTLVSHGHIPFWQERSVKAVGYHSHLYTRIKGDDETDEIEKWLECEFESPAEEPLQKVTSDARLAPQDWRHLVRFLAAQDVRTPARFIENLPRWNADATRLLNSTVKGALQKLEAAKRAGESITQPNVSNSEYLPFRATAEIKPDETTGQLKAEVVVGRGLWLFSIRHTLTKTLNVLHEHQWTILKPPEGLSWFTSDKPVVRLNFRGVGDYDLKGGWGVSGGEILLPLGPRHLLYTQIGCRPPRRGEVVSRGLAETIRRLLAENAYRMIFAQSRDEDVPALRPRVVNEKLFRHEQEGRRKWHEEQTAAERKLMGSVGT